MTSVEKQSKDMNGQYMEEQTLTANKHVGIFSCPNSLVIRETPIKIEMPLHTHQISRNGKV